MTQDLEDRYNVTIRVTDATGSYTEVQFDDCPLSSLKDKPIIGNILEQHRDLMPQKIKHLEVIL